MKDLSGKCRCEIQPGDRIALARRFRIAVRREHHAECRSGVPLRFSSIQASVERAFAQLDQIRLQPHHDWLRLGIAKATVELENVGCAIGRDHDACIQKAKIRRAVGNQAIQKSFPASNTTGFGTTTSAQTTGAINTATDQTFSLSATLANAADNIVLEREIATVIYGA